MNVPPPTREQGGLSNRQLGQQRRQQNSRAEKMRMAAAAAAAQAPKIGSAAQGTDSRDSGGAGALAKKNGNGQAGEAKGCETGAGGMLGFCIWKVVCGPILLTCYLVAAVRRMALIFLTNMSSFVMHRQLDFPTCRKLSRVGIHPACNTGRRTEKMCSVNINVRMLAQKQEKIEACAYCARSSACVFE